MAHFCRCCTGARTALPVLTDKVADFYAGAYDGDAILGDEDGLDHLSHI